MQASHVKDEFPNIERRINHAAQLCQITSDVPDHVRDRLSELERESDQAKQILATEENPNRIRECINRLETLGDRAMDACQSGANVNEEVRTAIRQAHDSITDIKHRLH
jgi:hypothetical protein